MILSLLEVIFIKKKRKDYNRYIMSLLPMINLFKKYIVFFYENRIVTPLKFNFKTFNVCVL